MCWEPGPLPEEHRSSQPDCQAGLRVPFPALPLLAWLLACLRLCLCPISFGCCQPELHTEAPGRCFSADNPRGSGLASLCLCPRCSLPRTPGSWGGAHQDPSFNGTLLLLAHPAQSHRGLRQHGLNEKVVELAATGCCGSPSVFSLESPYLHPCL